MTDAVAAYEDKPRDQWLFDYPAQVALCGTQIWWSAEVGIAFGKLEVCSLPQVINNDILMKQTFIQPQ